MQGRELVKPSVSLSSQVSGLIQEVQPHFRTAGALVGGGGYFGVAHIDGPKSTVAVLPASVLYFFDHQGGAIRRGKWWWASALGSPTVTVTL